MASLWLERHRSFSHAVKFDGSSYPDTATLGQKPVANVPFRWSRSFTLQLLFLGAALLLWGTSYFKDPLHVRFEERVESSLGKRRGRSADLSRGRRIVFTPRRLIKCTFSRQPRGWQSADGVCTSISHSFSAR